MESGSKRISIISEPVRCMDKLDESILIEILLLLPSVNSVTQCKLVCRHWNSVISSSHFKTSFLDHHSINRKTFAIIFINRLNKLSFFPQEDSIFKTDSPSTELKVLATYNDLSLCMHRSHCLNIDDGDDVHAYEIMNFYIYNPITKQSVALPPECVHTRDRTLDVAGFVFRGRSSFRVMYILRPDHYTHGCALNTMHIYSSEENTWMEYGLPGKTIVNDGIMPLPWNEYSLPEKGVQGVMALPWNGLLCWKSDMNHVFCDPYRPDDDECFHAIATPPEARKVYRTRLGLGVFQGTLRSCYLHYNLLSVWELKDYDTEEWSLKHEVWIGELRVYDNYVPLAFDPNDGDVAYFITDNSLYSFNMRSNVHSRLKTDIHLRKGSLYLDFFMLVVSGFPTPVPTIPRIRRITK